MSFKCRYCAAEAEWSITATYGTEFVAWIRACERHRAEGVAQGTFDVGSVTITALDVTRGA